MSITFNQSKAQIVNIAALSIRAASADQSTADKKPELQWQRFVSVRRIAAASPAAAAAGTGVPASSCRLFDHTAAEGVAGSSRNLGVVCSPHTAGQTARICSSGMGSMGRRTMTRR